MSDLGGKSLIVLVIVGGVCVASAAIWLAWLNRASEALRSNGATAVVVGAVGLLATLWFSLKAPEPLSDRFSVSFVVERQTLLPLAEDRYPFAAGYANPGRGIFVDLEPFSRTFVEEDRSSVDPGRVQRVYLDAMAAYVCSIIAHTFHASWDVEVVSDTTAAMTTTLVRPLELPPKGSTIRKDDVVDGLTARGLILASITPKGHEAVLPPRTQIRWEEDPRTRVLTLSNPYATVKITIEGQMPLSGSGGLESLAGLSHEESARLNVAFSYAIQLDASFERLRSGHPDMRRYTRWVDTLFSQLRRLDAAPGIAELHQQHLILRTLEAWRESSRLLEIGDR